MLSFQHQNVVDVVLMFLLHDVDYVVWVVDASFLAPDPLVYLVQSEELSKLPYRIALGAVEDHLQVPQALVLHQLLHYISEPLRNWHIDKDILVFFCQIATTPRIPNERGLPSPVHLFELLSVLLQTFEEHNDNFLELEVLDSLVCANEGLHGLVEFLTVMVLLKNIFLKTLFEQVTVVSFHEQPTLDFHADFGMVLDQRDSVHFFYQFFVYVHDGFLLVIRLSLVFLEVVFPAIEDQHEFALQPSAVLVGKF
jgi:hypothetical protein